MLKKGLSLGLDIGYGAVKVVTERSSLVFPSVCGHARPFKFGAEDITARHPGEQLQDDAGSWFVGDLALTQLPPGELLRLRGRTADEEALGNAFRVRMLKTALSKLLPGYSDGEAVHLRLAVGLPVDHMADAPALKETLLGQHLVRTDATHLVAHVSEVMVMPQPVGTIYAQSLTASGEVNPRHAYVRTGVVDVGTYTVDLALDDDGEFVGAESGSVEGGVSTVLERVAGVLEQEHRQKIPPRLLEGVLQTGVFTARGMVIDYRAVVEQALEPLRGAILNLMSDKWKTGATLDVIYLSGGGAPLVAGAVKSLYPQTVVLPEPQFANARGYLRYALFTALQALEV